MDNTDDQLMTTAEAARFLRLSPQTLCDLRSRGGGPRYCKLARSRICYLRSDLLRYALERRFSCTTDARLSSGRP